MKPKNKLATAIAAAIVMVAVLFIGGLFAQLMRNYALWQQAGGTLSSGNSPTLPSATLGAVLGALFSFPYDLYGILLTVALIAAVLFFVLRVGRDGSGTYDNERNFQYSDKGTYGTVGFMTEAERKQVMELEDIRKTKGVIVGAMDGKALSIPPGKRKCAYFCITSDQDSTFEFLSSLFFNFLFQDLTRYADDHCPGGKLTVPVHIIGDELMNAGKIINLGRRLSVIRSRALSISVIVQNLGQIQNRYPDNEWIEVVGNCDTTLFLGCTDDLTAKFISDRSGDVTIGYETEARMYSSMQLSRWTPEYRQTKSIGKRKLLTQDEVLRLPLDRELIILRGQKVLEADKCDFTMHPHAKLLKPCSAADHVPAWRSSRFQPSTPEPVPPDIPKPARKPAPPTQEEPLEIKSPHQLW